MKLNIRKLTVFTLFCGLSVGLVPQNIHGSTASSFELSKQEYDVLHKLSTKIYLITDLAKFLVNKIDDKKDPDTLDTIVRKFESLESLIITLICEIKLHLDHVTSTQDRFCNVLELKYEIIEKVHSILNRFANIIRNGLLSAIHQGELSPRPMTFINKIKGPLAELAAPAELNFFEKKLSELHSIIEEVNTEDTYVIKELLSLLHKIRKMTESNGKSKLEIYTLIGKKLPKKRAPFTGIPAKIDLEDWIGELQNNR